MKGVRQFSIWAFVGALLFCGAFSADAASAVRRIYRPERSVRGNENIRLDQAIDKAAWIWMPGDDRYGEAAMMVGRGDRSGFPAKFYRFRRSFEAQAAAPLRIDVSADERFVLFLDGLEIARGPHRGLPDHWFYESYEIGLDPGTHRLEAVVWQMGPHAPLAQLSVRGGFVLKAEGAYDAVLSTGRADWKVASLRSTLMTGQGGNDAWGVGSESRSHGTSFYGEEPPADAWTAAVVVRDAVGPEDCGVVTPGWFLFPSALPDQMHRRCVPGSVRASRSDLSGACYRAADADDSRVKDFAALLKGRPLTVPARTTVRFLWDLGNYYCAYPELRTQGGNGAEIRWDWTESLRNESDGRKGDRAAFADKRVERPFGDAFAADGRPDAVFTTPWWRCGRWCELKIRTADEPLTLNALAVWHDRAER